MRASLVALAREYGAGLGAHLWACSPGGSSGASSPSKSAAEWDCHLAGRSLDRARERIVPSIPLVATDPTLRQQRQRALSLAALWAAWLAVSLGLLAIAV